jgi:hypothetical protein
VTITGTGGSATPGCATLGIGDPQGFLLISQQAASLSGSSYAGFVLNGTLFDTDNFSLSGFDYDAGTSLGDSMFLQAQFVPDPSDGGTIQNGMLTTQYQRTQGASAITCSQSLPFTAQ